MQTQEKMLLTVVIPCRNEEGNLPGTVDGLKRKLGEQRIPFELVLVDDNSADRTFEVISEMASEDSRIVAVRRKPPCGFGRAVRSGLEQARGDVIAIVMADMSDSPDDVVACYRKIAEGYDCVFGSRFIEGSSCTNYPVLKLWVNRIVNRMLQVLFWTRFNDLTNSFKAYRAHVIREIGPLKACHFNITIELSLNALIRDYAIAQIPISWQGRTWGSSSLRLGEMGRRYLSTLLKVYFEKALILDDLLAESVSSRQDAGNAARELETRVNDLENRLGMLERTSKRKGLRPVGISVGSDSETRAAVGS